MHVQMWMVRIFTKGYKLWIHVNKKCNSSLHSKPNVIHSFHFKALSILHNISLIIVDMSCDVKFQFTVLHHKDWSMNDNMVSKFDLEWPLQIIFIYSSYKFKVEGTCQKKMQTLNTSKTRLLPKRNHVTFHLPFCTFTRKMATILASRVRWSLSLLM